MGRLLSRLAKYDVEAIDRFREHVHDGAKAAVRSIHKRAEGMPEEMQEFLADDLHELEGVTELTDQLAIVALYRVVELTRGRIVTRKFGAAVQGKAYHIGKLGDFLAKQGVDLAQVPHAKPMDELRLLNNAVKHSGRADDKLAKSFPRWKKGEQLKKLGQAYERLKRHIPAYVFRLAERVKL